MFVFVCLCGCTSTIFDAAARCPVAACCDDQIIVMARPTGQWVGIVGGILLRGAGS
jgi:hypothetical protein